MRERSLRPQVAAALAVAQEFARARGLHALYSYHWEETIDVSWQEGDVHKLVLVMVYRLWVEGVAWTQVGSPPQRVEVRRGFGRSNQEENGWESAFREHLERAWEWLQGMDAASVAELDAADEQHALCRIVPILQEFAGREGLRVRNVDRDRCILEWPRDVPQCQLAVLYSPEHGVGFIGLRYVRRGWLFKRRITVECGDLQDLALPDWTQLEDLGRRVSEARGRVEACIPGKDAVETYV
jgi:hypothetical protein